MKQQLPNPEFGPRVEEWESGPNNKNNPRIREQLLRQFMRTDGPKGNTKAYRAGYEGINWTN